MKKGFVISLSVLFLISLPTYGKKWTGTVIKEYDNSQLWMDLVTKMRELHMNYGAEAGSERILEYFSELKSKEFAYQNIVDLIDFGYPFNLRPVFMSGDLETAGKENFSQSYNLYKATLDLEKNMPKWADNYFAKVDKETFPKYLFYQALKEFNQKKLDDSLGHLQKALAALTDSPLHLSLSKKMARTMARIYYEQTKYKESLDIYQTYLLKLNPIEQGDWIEAAWALYRLGKYEEALGYLYNMEVKDQTQDIYLEKFIIRALIYREKCATSYTSNLSKDFGKQFGSTIEKIKMGESLKSLPLLKRLIDRGSEYRRANKTIEELQAEIKLISKLPGNLQQTATFLYETEIKNISKNRDFAEDAALSDAARHLVVMGESLRFLQFDVIREQYNPDKVFAPPPEPQSLVETLPDNRFLLHWIQWGDFWRDERMSYRGQLKNWCQ
ncbi:MAG: tetratricopeptide repeat protein [Pseudobdellovibrionaceae bacterium]